mgnify:FL=1
MSIVSLKWGFLVRLDAAATRLVFGHLGLGEIRIDADTFPQQTCLFDANQQQLLTAASGWCGWMIEPLKAEVKIVSPKRVSWANCKAKEYLTCWTISNAHFFQGIVLGFPILDCFTLRRFNSITILVERFFFIFDTGSVKALRWLQLNSVKCAIIL